jgi:hypothetical protein
MNKEQKEKIKKQLIETIDGMKTGDEVYLFNDWVIEKNGDDYVLWSPGNMEPDVITRNKKRAAKVLLSKFREEHLLNMQYFTGEKI